MSAEAFYFLEYEKLRRKNTSLNFEIRRLKIIEEKFGLCIKHLYLSGMTIEEISKAIRWDRASVGMILARMRVKRRKE